MRYIEELSASFDRAGSSRSRSRRVPATTARPSRTSSDRPASSAPKCRAGAAAGSGRRGHAPDRRARRQHQQTSWAGVDGSGPDPDLSVGNHWLDPGDNVVQMDDGRAALPVRLAPGDARRGAVDRARTRCSRLVPARARPRAGARRLVPRQGKHPVRGPRHCRGREARRPHGSASVPSGERGATRRRARDARR